MLFFIDSCVMKRKCDFRNSFTPCKIIPSRRLRHVLYFSCYALHEIRIELSSTDFVIKYNFQILRKSRKTVRNLKLTRDLFCEILSIYEGDERANQSTDPTDLYTKTNSYFVQVIITV